MAQIVIRIDYDPKPEHYPDCSTVEECVAFDVKAMNEGESDIVEFVSFNYDNAKVEVG